MLSSLGGLVDYSLDPKKQDKLGQCDNGKHVKEKEV